MPLGPFPSSCAFFFFRDSAVCRALFYSFHAALQRVQSHELRFSYCHPRRLNARAASSQNLIFLSLMLKCLMVAPPPRALLFTNFVLPVWSCPADSGGLVAERCFTAPSERDGIPSRS